MKRVMYANTYPYDILVNHSRDIGECICDKKQHDECVKEGVLCDPCVEIVVDIKERKREK